MNATIRNLLFSCKNPEKIETNIIGNILKIDILV